MQIIKAYKNNKIKHPINKEICQGLIFSCAQAEEYAGTDVFGFIVTARCDITHDKVHIYNYIPIVSLDDWLKIDGTRIILEQTKKNALNNVTNIFKNLRLSPDLLTSVESERIIAMIEDKHSSKTNKKTIDKLKLEFRKIKEIDNYDIALSRSVSNLSNLANSAIEDVLKRLFNHNLPGYYFLDDIEHDGKHTGYVLLLREVRMIPAEIMKIVTQGVDEEEAKIRFGQDVTYFKFSESWNYVYPVGKLSSPETEHVLQCFSLLFTRIGVEDINRSYTEQMIEHYSRNQSK
jgi:hypothetical protein